MPAREKWGVVFSLKHHQQWQWMEEISRFWHIWRENVFKIATNFFPSFVFRKYFFL
jgi:hypothetical protein